MTTLEVRAFGDDFVDDFVNTNPTALCLQGSLKVINDDFALMTLMTLAKPKHKVIKPI